MRQALEIVSLDPDRPIPEIVGSWRTWLVDARFVHCRSDVCRVGQVWVMFEVFRHATHYALYYPAIPSLNVTDALYLYMERPSMEERLAAAKDAVRRGVTEWYATRERLN